MTRFDTIDGQGIGALSDLRGQNVGPITNLDAIQVPRHVKRRIAQDNGTLNAGRLSRVRGLVAKGERTDLGWD